MGLSQSSKAYVSNHTTSCATLPHCFSTFPCQGIHQVVATLKHGPSQQTAYARTPSRSLPLCSTQQGCTMTLWFSWSYHKPSCNFKTSPSSSCCSNTPPLSYVFNYRISRQTLHPTAVFAWLVITNTPPPLSKSVLVGPTGPSPPTSAGCPRVHSSTECSQ
jgi:hypothetical protein